MSLSSAKPTLVSTLQSIFISWRGSGTTPDAESVAWAREKAEEIANAIHVYASQGEVEIGIQVAGTCSTGPLTGQTITRGNVI